MVQPLNWRLCVTLRAGTHAHTATLDFARRETIDMQLVQMLFRQHDKRWNALYEFMNEGGELLAFRAAAYDSHTVTEIDGT